MIMRRSVYFSVSVLLTALAVGCSRTGTLGELERPVRSDQITDFATLYGRNCAGCHGADGKFGPAPPLNDPLFLAIVPDSVLLQLVADGRPGTPMPGFSRKKGGSLTDEQVEALAGGIKSRWKAEHPAITPPGYLVSKSQERGDAGRGEHVFDSACASCHGMMGLGGKDMVGPIHDTAFLALISDQAIRRYIITGRRDLKMPDFASKMGRPSDFTPLTPTDVNDLVELLSSWRREDAAR
jgi:mono/diheme cytochrome c family protein